MRSIVADAIAHMSGLWTLAPHHGDGKPGNFVITPRSQAAGSAIVDHLAVVPFGAWQAPEASAELTTSANADLWALGKTLWCIAAPASVVAQEGDDLDRRASEDRVASD